MAIQESRGRSTFPGLLRFARNDGFEAVLAKASSPTQGLGAHYSAALAWTAGLFGCAVQSANGRA